MMEAINNSVSQRIVQNLAEISAEAAQIDNAILSETDKFELKIACENTDFHKVLQILIQIPDNAETVPLATSCKKYIMLQKASVCFDILRSEAIITLLTICGIAETESKIWGPASRAATDVMSRNCSKALKCIKDLSRKLSKSPCSLVETAEFAQLDVVKELAEHVKAILLLLGDQQSVTPRLKPGVSTTDSDKIC